MATLATLRDFVREQTLLETDDWPNTKIADVINEGIYEVATRFNWPYLADIATFSLVADQQAYTFATITNSAGTGKYVGKIESIVDVERRTALQEVAATSAWATYGGDMPESTDPTSYFIWGNSLYLLPVPSAAAASRIRMFYYRRPATLSGDADEPEWDPQFHYAAAYWACARAWEREEDYEKAQAWRAQFDARIEQMARFYLNRATDSPFVVGGGRGRAGRANTPWIDSGV